MTRPPIRNIILSVIYLQYQLDITNVKEREKFKMKNQIKKRITKIATAVTVSAIAIGACVGCANNANGGDAETISSVSVADISEVETTEVDPGEFTTELWSISYDPEKWHGYEDEGSVIINNLDAVAGSSYIEITELDAKTVEDAVAKLQDTKGKKLTAPEKAEVSGTECYVVYDEPTDSDEEGVTIFDYYLIFEKDGNIIVINESITQDPDEARAEALSYEFDDVIKTFALK